MLTLRQLLETITTTTDGQGGDQDRAPTRFGGLVEKRLVEMLRDSARTAGWRVRVMSFSFAPLQRVGAVAPEVRIVQLVNRGRSDRCCGG